MDTYAVWDGQLEIRQGGAGRTLSGRFPYGGVATVSDRGRVRKERINSRAFSWQMQEFAKLQAQLGQSLSKAVQDRLDENLERRNVHILSGHDFGKSLGDMKRGTARVWDDADALYFEVDLPDDADMPSHMLDTVKEIRTGRAGGISPGFRVPPRSAVPNAESLTPEPGNPGVQIRQVNQGVLHEISIVSRPVYGSTDIDIRAEDYPSVNTLLTLPKAGLLWL